MQRFWDEFLLPVARGCEAKVICEVGSQFGGLTQRLLDYCIEEGAIAHVIDPAPAFDVEAWRTEYGDALVFHRQLSLDALGRIPPPDLVLIDGDHNWYTVVNELRLLERQAVEEDEPLPVIVLHDVAWPYGRRDLYYDPKTVPEEHRQPFQQRGVHPESEELTDEGINGHLHNAVREGGARNGVLTAVEDFLAESSTTWILRTVPGFHGLGLLVPAARLESEPSLERAVAGWDGPTALRAQIENLESSRIAGEIRRAQERKEAERAGDEARQANEQAKAETTRLKTELAALDRARREELKRIGKDLKEIANSRSWRYGHRAMRTLRTLARRSDGSAADPMAGLLERLAELEPPDAEQPSADGAPERSSGAWMQGKRLRRLMTKGRLRAVSGRARGAARYARVVAPFQEDAAEQSALEAERESAADFARRYADTLPAPLDVAEPHDRSESIPVDRRGILAAPGNRPDDKPAVDVVVCVHDALADLRRCVLSLLARTGRPFHLIVVDDGSGPETRAFLSRLARVNPAIELVTREGPPHGYTLAANAGVRASTGDYVVLLNSDTVVTFGWLERLVECGESDSAIGIVGPLSNAASHQSIPKLRDAGAWAVNELPPFLTPDGLAFLLAGLSPRSCPRFPFLNGFCYAVKREVIDAIGLFDEENFASGYCEENDFSYRASLEGFELGVADSAYVFHAKSRSYGQQGRKEIAKRNYQVFLRKHGEQNINPLVHRLDRDTSLDPLREVMRGATADADAFARAFRSAYPEPLRIAFVLHGMGRAAAGGVHSIYQETRGMRALGIDAQVLVPTQGIDNARALYRDADEVFVGFGDEAELVRRTADRDVIVATHFRSVATVQALREGREDFLPAYYVQDYEPFFFPADSSEAEEALDSYRALEDGLLFAKTQWLCDLVGSIHGRHVAKVEPSIDHEVYRPLAGPRKKGRDPIKVVGMVRPRTRRRQPLGTLRILDRVQTELGGQVEVRAFGCEPRELRRLAPRRAQRVRNLGLLRREEVAAALGEADIFLDFSSYQAFGRTALEAMACGCVSIVPNVGGPAEYAIHGENAYVVDTTSEEPAFAAIAELAADRDGLSRMRETAVETAARFSVPRAALAEYVLFAEEHARRHALPRARA